MSTDGQRNDLRFYTSMARCGTCNHFASMHSDLTDVCLCPSCECETLTPQAPPKNKRSMPRAVYNGGRT